MNRWWFRDAGLVLLLAALLIAPLFTMHWMENWASIESTFIADARMLQESGFRPQWQPNWYCGTRWDYIYPPGLRYGTALIAQAFRVDAARAYHLYTATFYCLGILGVYLLIRTGQRSRLWAWLGVLATLTVSPSYLLFPRIRYDVAGEYYLPHRLNVLVRYGEGPHMTAWALLPIALALAWKGLRRGNNAYLAGAAIAAAGVVSNNFYGATALAMFFPMLCWALWLEHREWSIWPRAAAMAVLAYGLCAVWLTPSYIRLTLENMRFVSNPGNPWSKAVALTIVALLLFATWRWKRATAWPVFVAGSLILFSCSILGTEYLNFRIIGESARLIPELDLAIILAVLLAMSRVPLRSLAVLVVLLAIGAGGKRYIGNAWKVFHFSRGPESRVEYQISEWMHRNMPAARALATGSVRFWYNAWFTLPQTGGGSEQGVLNPNMVFAQGHILGQKPSYAILWAKATGTGAILVNDPESQEIYNDWREPHKFDGLLPVVYNDGKGNRIYQVPRVHPELARVVDLSLLGRVEPLLTNSGKPNVEQYVAAVESGPSVAYRRVSNEQIQVEATLGANQAILVQESYDPAWEARDREGRVLPIEPDALQFMVVRAPAGTASVELKFEKPLENRIGGWVLVGSVLMLLNMLKPARWKPAAWRRAA